MAVGCGLLLSRVSLARYFPHFTAPPLNRVVGLSANRCDTLHHLGPAENPGRCVRKDRGYYGCEANCEGLIRSHSL